MRAPHRIVRIPPLLLVSVLACLPGCFSERETYDSGQQGKGGQRFPDETLTWNARKMEVKGRPELKKYIQRSYREGWEIDV